MYKLGKHCILDFTASQDRQN